MEKDFDIVVIGGGHAGAEAAAAAARCQMRTALVTLDPSTIAQMSCNPAIGGVGKGQMVREIDALGGLMGLAADATGIQFRMLNRSKGPAVWGPRCQVDRHAYAGWMQRALAGIAGLTIIAAEAMEIITEAGRVIGIRIAPCPDESEIPACPAGRPNPCLSGRQAKSQILCSAVIVTAGTFLNGLMHTGERTWTGGRYDEPAASQLSKSLRRCGLELGRLKTGTCPRLAAESIDYDAAARQDGDEPPAAFSFMTDRLEVKQVPCWLTATTERVHETIRANLHRAPMYTGQIVSTGPRYCPSIETKIVRFPDKHSHQVFLEPEGLETNWVYANGITTSLPPDIQDEIVRSIPGLGRAEILRYGYAIEYDFAPPTQLKPTLETKCTDGLFLAGQVNGTTGYEEAAAQGLIAAVNAAAHVTGRDPLVLRRDQAYIAVMIDDLVTKGVTEPYRMFTSRAEHRLRLRGDNANRRLTEVGRSVGLVRDDRWARFSADRQAVAAARTIFDTTRIDGKTICEMFRGPETTLDAILSTSDAPTAQRLTDLCTDHRRAIESLAVDYRYAGYLAKEEKYLRHTQKLAETLIPSALDYAAVSHLRHEAREKLSAVGPRDLAHALRVEGVTPADVTVLAVHLAARGKTT